MKFNNFILAEENLTLEEASVHYKQIQMEDNHAGTI